VKLINHPQNRRPLESVVSKSSRIQMILESEVNKSSTIQIALECEVDITQNI
jgi:hypothetical protein